MLKFLQSSCFYSFFLFFWLIQRALAQERYLEAAFLRDNAGAGLVSSHKFFFT